MHSQTSLVAANVRLQDWAIQIKECRNRPENMTVDEWCERNHITKANYYYRLRRVREACLDAMPQEMVPAFVEIREPMERNPHPSGYSNTPSNDCVCAVMTLPNGLRLELTEKASEAFLIRLIGAMNHVK